MSEAKDILKEELKNAGLDMAEDAAIAAVKAIFKAVPRIVAATPAKWDDMFGPAVALVEKPVIDMLEGIYKGDNEPGA